MQGRLQGDQRPNLAALARRHPIRHHQAEAPLTIGPQIPLPKALSWFAGGHAGGSDAAPAPQPPLRAKGGRIRQGLPLALGPLGVMPRGIPKGKGTGRSLRVLNQAHLNYGHGDGGWRLPAAHRQCGRQPRRLAHIEHQGLQPCGAIGHMADADGLIRRQQIADAGADQGPVGNREGGTAPATTPATALGRQRPIGTGVMMVIGVIPHGNSAAASPGQQRQGGPAGPRA